MKLNASTALISSKILLVPYEPHHVLTYSAWMDDEEIREATASERLTLSEEYEMQQKWRVDADKLTFISCLPPTPPILEEEEEEEEEYRLPRGGDAPERMVGDVNLFLYEEDESEDEEGEQKRVVIGEVELMIALRTQQGKGLGRASLLLFLHYILLHRREIIIYRSSTPGVSELSALRAKINQTNTRSIRLFESVGFVKKSGKPNYFGEFELVMKDMTLEGVEKRMREFGMEGWREVRY